MSPNLPTPPTPPISATSLTSPDATQPLREPAASQAVLDSLAGVGQAQYVHEISVLREWLDATLLNGFPLRRTEIESWQAHTPFASALITLTQPAVFVELGTHKGDSYCAICETVQKRALPTQCVAVDCWQGDEHSGGYDDTVLKELRAHHDPLYAPFSRLHQSFFDEAVAGFEDGSIDLLHIDGLHSEEAVLHDFETWKPKLSERAVVLFHDTHVHENDFGVFKVWSALSKNHPHFEFTHGNGLGVLAVGPNVPQAIKRLCELATSPSTQADAQTLRNTYEALGSSVLYQGRAQRLWRQADELWARTQTAESELDHTKQDDRKLWNRVQKAETDLAHFKEAHQAAWARIAKAEEDLQVYQSAHQEAWDRIRQAEDELTSMRELNTQLQERHEKLLKIAKPVLGLARFIARLKNNSSNP